jgi:hypothetical protein
MDGGKCWESPVAELLEDVVGAYALRHLRKLRLGKFSCKPVNDSISSKSVGERVGKSPVAELLEDVVGARTLQHLQKFRLGNFFPASP